jgi:hypothetical protein
MSVTVHVTVVVPTGNTDGASFVTDCTPQLSEVAGVPSETPLAEHFPASAFTVTAAGHVIVGFSLSTTVTLCVQVAVLPRPSVTVHVTLVVPTGNSDGALFVTVIVPQPPPVVGVPSATSVAPQAPASALTVRSGGQAMDGGVQVMIRPTR